MELILDKEALMPMGEAYRRLIITPVNWHLLVPCRSSMLHCLRLPTDPDLDSNSSVALAPESISLRRTPPIPLRWALKLIILMNIAHRRCFRLIVRFWFLRWWKFLKEVFNIDLYFLLLIWCFWSEQFWFLRLYIFLVFC